MTMDRRDLLKFFGIGATITPVVGGAPLIEASAQLLEIPRIDLLSGGNEPKYYQDRLKWNPYEAIWLRAWQIANLQTHGHVLNHLLEHEATPEEKELAAAIVQWFGTNVGHCFVEQTLEACGYKIQYERGSKIHAMQYGNVWDKQLGNNPYPQELHIPFRGRTVVLRANLPPEIR